MKKSTIVFCFITIALYMLSSGVGLFNQTTGSQGNVTNVFGQVVDLHGNGLYENDSAFKAPIFEGTDAVILLLIGPLSFILLIFSWIKEAAYKKYLLASIMSFFLYQGLSVALGTVLNQLFFLYIIVLGLNIIALIKCVEESWKHCAREGLMERIPRRGIIWLLGINVAALVAAWLPEVIQWTVTGEAFRTLEHYNTGLTKVLDLGVIVPLILFAIVLIFQKKNLGLMIYNAVIGVGILIGFVVIGQTIYQLSQAVELSMGEIIGKGVVFSILSIIGIMMQYKVVKQLQDF
jgi:uncharacterized membrane protein (DUF485 family)